MARIGWPSACTAKIGNGSRTVSGGTHGFLRELGVPDMAARTSPFDPGYDPATVVAHLSQSGRLMSLLKLSMACWLVADEAATRTKIAAAQAAGVPTVVGGGPFEIAAVQGRLMSYPTCAPTSDRPDRVRRGLHRAAVDPSECRGGGRSAGPRGPVRAR